MKKGIISLGLVAAMGVTVLAGCSSQEKVINISVPKSAQELAESVVNNMENVSSFTAVTTEVLKGDMKIMGETIGTDMDLKMDTKAYSEGKDDISYTKMEVKSTITGLEAIAPEAGDSSTNAIYEMYSKGNEDDGKYTVYAKEPDSKWTKSEVNIAPDVLNGQISLCNEVAKGRAEATFTEDTEKVNRKDVYKMEIIASGDYLMNLLGGISVTGIADADTPELKALKIPVTLYIEKDTKYVAKMEIDAKEIGEQMFNQMSGGASSVEGFSIELKDFKLETVFDSYNLVPKFEISERILREAGDAPEKNPANTTAEDTTESAG